MTAPTTTTPRTVLCDLDGVIWLSHEPIAGSSDAVARLREAGCRLLFVTNNSSSTIADHEQALAEVGVDAHGDVISSATAAGRLVSAGQRVLVTGGGGIVEAVAANDAEPVLNTGASSLDGLDFDVVIVGHDRGFDFPRLRVAARALHRGARLIGTNSDPTFPTPHGLEPGGGSIIAAVATAGETTPQFAGKPNAAMAQAIVAHLGGKFDAASTVMVGDRRSTDGQMANRLGCRFALVRSDVGTASRDGTGDDAADVVAEVNEADLAGVVSRLLA